MDGECVSLAHDLSTGSVRRAVVVPLYPLAEWAAFNWWRLLYDARPAQEHAATTPSSHRLSSAGVGQARTTVRALRLSLTSLIEAVEKTLEATIVDDLLDAVEPEHLRGAVAWAASAGERAARESVRGIVSAFTVDALDPVREPVARAGSAPADMRPWEQGYRAARAVRQRLDIPAVVPFPDAAPVRIEVEAAQDTALQGLGRHPAGGATANPVVPRELQPMSARFAVARSLWHLLAQSGDNPFLLTAAATTAQQVGRAFAAELLAQLRASVSCWGSPEGVLGRGVGRGGAALRDL